MNASFDPALLRRVEEAGVNASAPREQLWIDGWLVRFSPGKAKRARCVQAVAPGHLPLDRRLARCLAVYAAAELQPVFRITPFSAPADLDAYLAARGMERIDDTRVMVVSLLEGDPVSAQARFRETDATDFAEWIGAQRGSTPAERAAHADRLRGSPVRHRALLMIDDEGTVLAGGQAALEDDLVGLYDVFTIAQARGRGLARDLCTHLLDWAIGEGARTAYLQVDAANEVARRVYRRLGFEDAYAYHYRSPPAA